MADVKIRLGSKTYGMRPTYAAAREIEHSLGHSIATMLRLLAGHELRLEEAQQVVFAGISEAQPSETFAPDHVGERLFELGIGSEAVRGPIAQYLIELQWCPDELKKKEAWEWWTENEAAYSRIFSPLQAQSGGDRPTSGGQPQESSGPSFSDTVKNRSGEPPQSAEAIRVKGD